MSMIDKAVEYVRSRCSAVEQARLNFLLTGKRPAGEAIDQLFAGQRSDGGWPPFWAPDYSSLDATCFRLAQAGQLGVEESEPALSGAVQFLARRQSPDGSWEEEKTAAARAPHWAAPGDLGAKMYLTANCGFWLALLGNPGHRAEKAAGFLRFHLDPEGHLPSYLHSHWLAGGLWHQLKWEEPSQRVLNYLAQRVDDLAVSNLSWLITTLCAAGIAPSHPLLIHSASRLERSQQDDGCWPSEDGPSKDVHSTLEALRALELCGRSIKPQGADKTAP